MSVIISLIVPTKNEEKNISRCIKSIQGSGFSLRGKKNRIPITKHRSSSTDHQLPLAESRSPNIGHRPPIEIIVADNQSTDQTAAIAKKLGAKVFQAGPERSAQRNFGARKAQGKFLFFVDADMELGEKVLTEALDLFHKDSDIKSIVVPEVSVGNNFWGRVRALERSCYLGEPTIEAPRIFEKKAFLKAGGFDQKLIAAEDWDLSQRIKQWGKMGRIKAKIIHHEGKLSLKTHLKKKYYYAKNIKLYAQKHPHESKAQIGPARVKIFWKNWKKLAADPLHGAGVFILKSMEYLVYLVSLVK